MNKTHAKMLSEEIVRAKLILFDSHRSVLLNTESIAISLNVIASLLLDRAEVITDE